MYMINLETVNILKGLQWSSVNTRNFYHNTTDEELTKKITGIDIPTVKKLNADKDWSCQFEYEKDDEGKIIFTAGIVLADDTTVWEQEEKCDNDLLEMFPKEEPAEKADSIASFFENDADWIVEELKSKYREKFEEIEQVILDNLDDHQKEDIADEWIGENTDDAWEKVLDERSDWAIKDFVKDYIQDNL